MKDRNKYPQYNLYIDSPKHVCLVKFEKQNENGFWFTTEGKWENDLKKMNELISVPIYGGQIQSPKRIYFNSRRNLMRQLNKVEGKNLNLFEFGGVKY